MKTKKLPLITSAWRTALESCATVSILQQTSGMPERLGDGSQFVSYIFSDKSFSVDYIARNRSGDLIIKSDLFKTFNYKGQHYCRSVKKSSYPNHHIKEKGEMKARIESIISVEVPNKVY